MWYILKTVAKQTLSRIGLALLVAATVTSATLGFTNANRIIWGVTIGDVSVAGTTRDQALRTLEAASATFSRQPITVSLKGQSIAATPEILGVRVDASATAEAAWRFGRDANPVRAATSQLRAAVVGARLHAVATVDGGVLDRFIAEHFADAETPMREPALVWRNGTPTVVPGVTGRLADRNRMQAALRQMGERLTPEPLGLALVSVAPTLPDRAAQASRKQVEAILAAAPYELIAGSRTVTVDRNLLQTWLTFPDLAVDLDPDAIAEFLTALAPSVSQSATNAILDVHENELVEAQPSREALRLLITENIDRIREHLLASRADPLALHMATDSAAVSVARARERAVTARLARAETDFSGSSASRVHNIKTAAAKYNGFIIEPDATFSFNDTIGPIDASTGYEFALVIKNGKTIPEYGGGVCQVSTTLFQAAAKAGLEIIKRFPHAYPVRYYGVPGFDATIYPGGPDLAFRNDTGTAILIQMQVVNTKLIVDLFGAPDGREVVLAGPYQFDRQPDGAVKARLTQTVKRGSEVVRTKTFWSNYKSPDLYPVERNPLE